MKSPTLEEYKEAGEEFWPKYDYVAQNIGEGAKPEDILKIMESLASISIKKRVESKLAPFGFNKQNNEKGNSDE